MSDLESSSQSPWVLAVVRGVARLGPAPGDRLGLQLVSRVALCPLNQRSVRFTQRGRPPRGQSVSFGEKFVVFEVDERLLYVVEMILI